MGGSSGGGGSSGAVDYPDYMKDKHKRYLDRINELLPAPNPFVNINAPSISPITNNTSIEYLDSYLQARIEEVHSLVFEPSVALCMQQPTFYNQVMQLICLTLDYLEANHNVTFPSDIATQVSYLEDRISEIKALDDLEGSLDLETTVYPRFSGGMRDINAVQMSTFIIGRSVIEGTYRAKVVEIREGMLQDVWKMKTELATVSGNMRLEASKVDSARVQNVLQVMASLVQIGASVAGNIDTIKAQLETALKGLHVELIKIRETALGQLDTLVDSSTGKNIELSRMQVVAAFEQSNVNIDYDEKQYRWDLENFQYLANMLAAVGSGTASAGGRQTSKFSSALGGALSGAAAGSMVSPGWGTAIGAVVGAGASLLG